MENDWADKIADSFYMGNGIDIAAALRKAKADGYREAAQIAVSDLGEGDIDFIAFKLRLEADKIENSPT